MPELPHGTVTFLFTDIEGSTRLWERDRAMMRATVDRHLALLGAAIAANGGIHFKTVGDAVQAAFHTAPKALAAAIEGQRAMLTEPWPEEIGPLRVRMAIHAGSAEPAAGDYLAPALNRLSRTLAAAHGGQILVSDVARSLVADDHPPGVSLRSLGRHALRDLQAPEEIFQAVVPGLPEDFPALRSLPHHPTNLVVSLTPLIGRDDALTAVTHKFRDEDARLVTLTGPGGSGKTRLAVEIAAELLDVYPDGVFFVDLASLRDPALVLPTIASILNIRKQPTESLPDALTAYLATKSMLLVLDNCEQVIDAAPDIAALLTACPRLAILATSREPFRVRSEQEYPVSPLALPDGQLSELKDLARVPSVALFVARASASDPRFALTEENAVAVAEICRRLDGLPLAIELAAARVKHLSPRALLDRLDLPRAGRLPFLTGGPRDLPSRQQTMGNTIAWSHDLLDDDEQVLFQLLSVFPSGFTLEGAEWVSGESRGGGATQGRDVASTRATEVSLDPHSPISPSPSPDTQRSTPPTLDLLASLVAKSLVVYEGDSGGAPRYRMLETIREFGHERLAESGREATARQRHAEWALALAERTGPMVKGPDAALWLELLERDQASLRLALGWLVERRDGDLLTRMAGALWPFWQEHAHYSEGRRWLQAALELGQAAPAEDRLRVMSGAGTLAWYQREVAYARQLHEQALVLAQEIGDRATEAFVLGNLGALTSELGDYAQADARFEASLAMAREVGDPGPVVLALHNLAHQEWGRGQAAQAMSRLEEALEVAREHRMGSILPSILVGLGTISTDLGDLVLAIGYFRESITLGKVRGNLGDVIDGIGGLARIAAVTGQPEAAVRLFGVADAMREGLAIPLSPSELTYLEPIMDGLRDALGDEGFSTTWSEGRSLSQEEALGEALNLRIETAVGTSPKAAPRAPVPGLV